MVVNALFLIFYLRAISSIKRLRREIESLEAKIATITSNSNQQVSAGAPVSSTPLTVLSPSDIGVAVPLGSPLDVGIPPPPYQRARIADSDRFYSHV